MGGMMKKKLRFDKTLNLWEIWDSPRTGEMCFYRHAIVWLMLLRGHSYGTIARVVGKDRSTLYNSVFVHTNMLWAKDEEYQNIFRGVWGSRTKFINILEGKMGRDLSACYSIDQAYEYGYEDARTRTKSEVVEKINYAKAMIAQRVKDNENGLHLCEINSEWGDFLMSYLDDIKEVL